MNVPQVIRNGKGLYMSLIRPMNNLLSDNFHLNQSMIATSGTAGTTERAEEEEMRLCVSDQEVRRRLQRRAV